MMKLNYEIILHILISLEQETGVQLFTNQINTINKNKTSNHLLHITKFREYNIAEKYHFSIFSNKLICAECSI